MGEPVSVLFADRPSRVPLNDNVLVLALSGVLLAGADLDFIADEIEDQWNRLSFVTRQSLRRLVEAAPDDIRLMRLVEVCDSYLMGDEIEEGVFWWR